MIPLRTDRRLRHTPWVNVSLILANVAVFMATYRQIGASGGDMYLTMQQMYEQYPATRFFLRPNDLHWWQFFSYQFLHGDIWHLAGNMIFLWVFGNCLEDRLRPLGYVLFYLAGGVVAGIGHVLSSDSPCLGASGSIAAVAGAFLALFPMTRVTILWPFIIIFFTQWPSMYFILFAFAKDVLYHFAGYGRVAYMAHISGDLFGFAVGMVLLATRVLPREAFDFLAMVDRWHRRRVHRQLVTKGQSHWQADAPLRMKPGKSAENDQEIMELRTQIRDAVQQHDGSRGGQLYRRLVELQSDAVLSREVQRDLASLAMQAGDYHAAAQAYEGYLAQYTADSYTHELNLILGVIYARYLNQPDKARPRLIDARDEHRDESRRALARQVLEELPQA